MCYSQLNYDDYLILGMFYIKMSCIFVFLTNIQYVILWYFMLQFLKRSMTTIKSDLDQQQHSQTPKYCYPNTASTERRSNIGGQTIVVRHMLT